MIFETLNKLRINTFRDWVAESGLENIYEKSEWFFGLLRRGAPLETFLAREYTAVLRKPR